MGNSQVPLNRKLYTTGLMSFSGNILQKTRQFNKDPVKITAFQIKDNKFTAVLTITGKSYMLDGSFSDEYTATQNPNPGIAQYEGYYIYGSAIGNLDQTMTEDRALTRSIKIKSFYLGRTKLYTPDYKYLFIAFDAIYGNQSDQVQMELLIDPTVTSFITSDNYPLDPEIQRLIAISNVSQQCFQPDPKLPESCVYSQQGATTMYNAYKQINDYIPKITDNNKTILQLQDQINKQTPDYQKCISSKQQATDIFQQLNLQIKQIQDASKQLTDSIAQQKSEIMQVSKDKSVLTQKIKDSNNTQQPLLQQISSIQNQIGQETKTLEDLLQSNKQSTDQIEQNKQLIDTIQQQLTMIQNILKEIPQGSDIQVLIQNAQQALDQSNAQQAELNTQIDSIKSSIQQYQPDAQAKQVIDQFNSEILKRQQDISILQKDIADLQLVAVQRLYKQFNSKGDFILILLFILVIVVLVLAIKSRKEKLTERRQRLSCK